MAYRRISPPGGSADDYRYTQPILKKGRACVNCRRRKMKCDGVQPTCGSCLRTEKAEDCEYTTGSERSTSQRLEDEVHRLQARLRDLQMPTDSQQGIILQQPYARPVERHQVSLFREPRDTLLSKSHASQFGFFLHPGRFKNSVVLPASVGHESRPAAFTLVYHVPVWDTSYNSTCRTRYFIHHTHPKHRLHVIQAEVLLTHYFFGNKRPVEGKYHSNAAYSLAIASGIHRMKTRNPPESTLPTTADDIEEGERVNAYWAIFCADNEWAGVFNCNPNNPPSATPTNIRYDSNASEIEEYESALHAKAAFLFERGRAFSRMLGMELSSRQRNDFGDNFHHIRNLALGLKSTSPPLDTWLRNPNIDAVRTAYVGITLLDAALIRLHGAAAAQGDDKARQQRVITAQEIINNAVRLASASWNFGFLNPIIGFAWREAFDVLFEELRNRHAAQSSWPARHSSSHSEDPFRRQLRKGVASFSIYSNSSSFIRGEVEEMTNSLQGGSPIFFG
ncbi:hypothetical protein D9756_011578 [Leucocoprinus leucothites]|uniref:Zn(2)-C6 fungal-type domain-containing protein n=1 Tax=Leucocoprinus leucothites TaxID=201217 RepID=A0A8H5CKA9_9AGAR|nr:hypothetical protein D9756_011578 [Leucoagaricus leucothites]